MGDIWKASGWFLERDRDILESTASCFGACAQISITTPGTDRRFPPLHWPEIDKTEALDQGHRTHPEQEKDDAKESPPGTFIRAGIPNSASFQRDLHYSATFETEANRAQTIPVRGDNYAIREVRSDAGAV